MSESSSTPRTGITWLSLLGAAFIFCKLAGVTEIATWSWIWVLLPFWIGLALFATFLVFMGGIAAIAALFTGIASLFRGGVGGDKWARKNAEMAAQERRNRFNTWSAFGDAVSEDQRRNRGQ